MKDDLDSKDDTKELKRQLNKTNSNFKAMREMFNQNAAALSELQEQARKNQDLEKEVATLRAAANDIFFSFTGYVKALESLFLDPNKQRQAERDLSHLRQTKSATLYAAEFRRLAARLHMTDESKVFAFYQGLKDEVKDEIAKLETPPSFLAYVEHAIKVDNRLYE
ncbi:Retrotransposon-derived protein PEG10 [Colletotrichum aenigma]|uniref:Retrotransposon-derived protein PEG10 n=1 Tax=Colletotrichum aenigma TaxID=1215731 RepID=UPI0018726FE1|nr:Retrotransposon-derived protein PEG10 [Colletotrichum aenigma]KAF5525027.1 Retrotransposon-derived protein PEG10 [Colletotrichum aenigma]